MSAIKRGLEENGFDYETLKSKMKFDQFLTVLGFNNNDTNDDGHNRHTHGKEEGGEENTNVMWLPADACNPDECASRRLCNDCMKCSLHCSCRNSRRRLHNFSTISQYLPQAMTCDPRTCMKPDRKITVISSNNGPNDNNCNPESCGEILFCDECTRCKKHCLCNIDENSHDSGILEDVSPAQSDRQSHMNQQ